ncbi:ABC transporter permease [Longirhabdus pacifica]|uniref:ABC transporter permease n=1 Tax=Longirhabdus pacifica TaxID=2305227 RepID=UPI001F0C5A84|nr:ABC transporter permease [Longirhabdus pacifica]
MEFMKDVFSLYFERSEFFLTLLYEHIIITFIAIVIITIIGVTSGILITRNKVAANIVLAATNFLYTIPSIALFGILVPLVGIGDKNAIIALSLYGLLPIIRNTYVGITEVDNQIIESAIGMGTTQKQLLFKIQLPLALPVIFAGFRTMVIMTIALAAIAAFIGGGGLGVAIWRGITTYFTEMIMAGSLLVALLAIVTDFILGIIEKRLRIRILGKTNEGGIQS